MLSAFILFIFFIVKVRELPPAEAVRDSSAHVVESDDSDEEYFDPLPIEDPVDSSAERFVVPLEPEVVADTSVDSAQNISHIPQARNRKKILKLKKFFSRFYCISRGED